MSLLSGRKLLVSSFLTAALLATSAEASDNFNLCSNAPGDRSKNVELPKDDTYHYTSAPVNIQLDADGAIVPPSSALWEYNGWESDLKTWHWQGYYNGAIRKFDGYRFLISIYNYDFHTWVKLGIFALVGPDGKHEYSAFDFGQFSAPDDSYDLQIGGWRARGSRGIESEEILSDDGLFGVQLFENSLKNLSYPLYDGFAEYISPTTGDKYGETYYWARPLLSSIGIMTYNGQEVLVIGTSWQDRQWRGQSFVKWNWASIQLENGMTLAAFDIVEKSSGEPVIHSLNIEGAPPACDSDLLSDPEDWELQASGSWTSPDSGVTYATHFRLVAPSRGIDLALTPVTVDQEITSIIGAIPGAGGSWEGAMNVQGTVNGRRIKGRAYVEQFNI